MGEQTVNRLMGDLTHHQPHVRQTAIVSLGKLGPLARPALSLLTQALVDDQPENRQAAANALAQIETGWAKTPEAVAAVPALIKRLIPLEHRPQAISKAAAAALTAMGALAVPALLKVLEQSDREKQQLEAIRVLGQIGPEAAPAIPALTRMLSHQEWYLRQAAAKALGEVGPQASNTVPLLVQTLGDWNDEVRQAAATALGQLGIAAETGTAKLIERLVDTSEPVRRAAAQALVRIGLSSAGPVLPLLTHADPQIRQGVARLLGQAGCVATEDGARICLICSLVDPAEGVRNEASDALHRVDLNWQQHPTVATALPTLLAALTYQKESESYIYRPLHQFGFASIPRLVISPSDDWKVRQAAARWLGRLPSFADQTQTPLAKALTDHHEAVRKAAAEAVAHLSAR
jgi:HEAT repeat protein